MLLLYFFTVRYIQYIFDGGSSEREKGGVVFITLNRFYGFEVLSINFFCACLKFLLHQINVIMASKVFYGWM